MSQALKYKAELLDLFKYLHQKTYAKRGFSATGKLLSSTLLTLTHTYPLENKFANLDEWESKRMPCHQSHKNDILKLHTEFKANHYQHWGRLYSPGDVRVRRSLSSAT